MVIFISGEDAFRRQVKVSQLLGHFQKKFDQSGYNFDIRDALTTSLQETREIILAPPFLGTRRFILIKSCDLWSEEVEFLALLKHIPETTIAVFCGEFKSGAVEKMNQVVEGADWHIYDFPKLSEGAAARLVLEEVMAAKGKMSSAVANALVRLIGVESWALVQETRKIIAYADGEEITLKMVESLANSSLEEKIFSFIDAFSEGRRVDALRLFSRQIALGVNPLEILTMLERQCRLSLSAKSAYESGCHTVKELAAALSVHPFVAEKLFRQIEKPKNSAEVALSNLVEIDWQIKNGRHEGVLALTLFIMKV